MQLATARILNETGLHARPAAIFVNTLKKFHAQVRVRNLTEGSAWVDAKNILAVLGLGAECGHELELEIDGSDELQALETIKAALDSGLQ
jgi:multiphosphoryl transfer protein